MFRTLPAKSFRPVPRRMFSTEPIKHTITTKLTQRFTPLHLEIENESYKHSVPKGSETHFKVILVSSAFEGKSLLEQHRLVNTTLQEELQNGVHALALKTMTPEKWSAQSGSPGFSTPNCLGGSKK